MADFKKLFSRVLPGVKTYLVAWSSLGEHRPPHFRLFGAPPPEPLSDRGESETSSINAASEKYFEQDELREYWHNRPFSEPDKVGKYLERFGQLLAMLRLRPGDRVLDFGCGTGWTSIMLARTGADVIGMDIAPKALAIAREVADRELTADARARLEFRTYSGSAIDLVGGEIDTVVVFDAFHHFPNPKTVLDEFHRVLGPHGRFGFAEPGVGHAASEISRAETEHGILEQDLDLVQLYESGIAAGFEGLDLTIPALEPEILTLPMDRMRLFLRGMSWLVPQDFIRKAVLMGPIGVFRKSAYAVTSLNPRAHRAKITPLVTQLSARRGDAIRVVARVENVTETAWLAEGRHGRGYVRLGAHLLTESGAVIDSDYGRAQLPRDVAQGEAAIVKLSLTAPSDPGDYVIELDMVNEGVCWFAEQGSEAATVRLGVS